jgi:hypothetical protein
VQVAVRLPNMHHTPVGSFMDSHEGFNETKHILDICKSYVDGSYLDEMGLISREVKDKIKKDRKKEKRCRKE